MRFSFKRKADRELFTCKRGGQKYPVGVVDAFFEVMSIVAAAPDEREFYAFKSLKFKKLKRDKEGKRSLRLNDQYRLVVTIERDTEGKYLQVHEINKH